MKKILLGVGISIVLNYLDKHILIFKEKTPKPRFERISPGLWVAAWGNFMFISDLSRFNKVMEEAIAETEREIQLITKKKK
jgi:hypothetical protein